ncbi:MAG TPA: DinB family protein [Vicinamibacterales bacterium]|nr:DinB family protein [Vicinamibacterales bacterium]
MTVKDIQALYEYGYWANGKILPVVAQLTPEQFTRQVAGSYGSVRNTMVHMMSAEWGWMDRCGGPPRGPALKADDYPTPATVIDRWRIVERDMRAFLAKLTDADLDRSVEFAFGGPTHVRTVCQLLRHAANHGVHHRGQVALLLRALGVVPGNVDMLFYFPEPAREAR